MYICGVDIGGTKCAVSIGKAGDNSVTILAKKKIATPADPYKAIEALVEMVKELVTETGVEPGAIGISCGSPLDSKNGIIKEPPNLPGWVDIDIITPFEKAFNVKAAVQNDANACALAEWLWGAGQGYEHMVFLTFGTGMGAGLILNGRIYTGISDMAGEVGHIRLENDGPVGYNKAGSFEGFCSGGRIARLGRIMMREHKEQGKTSLLFDIDKDIDDITAEDIGKAAEKGDDLAVSIYHTVGTKLGKGLAVIVDILNPQIIVIGSIFARQEALLRGPMEEELRREALDINCSDCKIVPAGLGENLGDYAALSVAMNCLRGKG